MPSTITDRPTWYPPMSPTANYLPMTRPDQLRAVSKPAESVDPRHRKVGLETGSCKDLNALRHAVVAQLPACDLPPVAHPCRPEVGWVLRWRSRNTCLLICQPAEQM